jgi:hypothetical protein
MEVEEGGAPPAGAASEEAAAEGVPSPGVAPVTPPPPEELDEEALQEAELLREERKTETELHMWEAWERHCAVYLLSCAMGSEGPQGLEGLPPPFATMQEQRDYAQTCPLCSPIWITVDDEWYSFGMLPNNVPTWSKFEGGRRRGDMQVIPCKMPSALCLSRREHGLGLDRNTLAAFLRFYSKNREIPLLNNGIPRALEPMDDQETDRLFGVGRGVGDIPAFRGGSLAETTVVYVNVRTLSDKVDALLNLGRIPRGPFTFPSRDPAWLGVHKVGKYWIPDPEARERGNLFGVNPEITIAEWSNPGDLPKMPKAFDISRSGADALIPKTLSAMLRHPCEVPERGPRPALRVDSGGSADIRVVARLLGVTVAKLVGIVAAEAQCDGVHRFEVAIYRPTLKLGRLLNEPMTVNDTLPIKDDIVFWPAHLVRSRPHWILDERLDANRSWAAAKAAAPDPEDGLLEHRGAGRRWGPPSLPWKAGR